jgi:AAHS family benzoate transporter-like MFS transporter
VVTQTVNPATRGNPAWVLPLCWTAVLLDGFDLVVLGTVLPSLLDYEPWHLTPGSASLISVVGLVGMTIGAISIGTVTDVIGRRKALLIAVAGFSLFTLLCAMAPSPLVFAALRFLAGLGLGGCLPTAITLVTEYSRRGRSGSATTTVMTGYHVGAVLTALLGILVIPHLGWRAMFVLGAAPALVIVPLMLRHLPESTSFLAARAAIANGTTDVTASAGKRAVSTLFRGGMVRSTVAFWVTSFMGLLLVYGLNTWLPQIMREAGYELGAALALLLVLNVGAVIGLLVAGTVADRIGSRRSAVSWFAGAALFLAMLSVKLPGIGVYVSVLLAGMFVFSAQVLVYAYVSRAYPPEGRATALGGAAGVGRIGAICGPLVGGWLLSAGIAYPWGFYVFAAVAAIGAVSVSLAAHPPEDGRHDVPHGNYLPSYETTERSG